MTDEGRSLSCANGCVLPDDERLFDITGEKFHAVMVREAKGWENYNGPEPAEYEPCGPVMSGRVASNYTITVQAFDMTDDQIDALFDRVADAAHALDEQVTVGGGRLTTPAREDSR